MKNNRDLLILQAIVAATRNEIPLADRVDIIVMAEICANNILIMTEFGWDVLPDPPITAKEIDAVLAMRVFDAITSHDAPAAPGSP
jgi:hypothetical protein